MCQHEQSERDTVQLILDFNEGSIAKDKAVALARELWVSWYGIARTSPVMRRADFGRKRKPGGTPLGPTTAWLKKRRRAISDEARHTNAEAATAEVAGDDVAEKLPETIAEEAFQAQRLRERRIEAFRANTLLKDEAEDAGLQADRREFEKKEHSNLMDVLRKAKRRDCAQRQDVDIAGRQFFTRCVGPPIGWTRDVQLGLQRVEQRRAATLFIVDDATQPGDRILWVAALVGGCITTPARDVRLVYKRALNLQRFVWLSPRFERRHSGSAAIIRALVTHSHDTRWRLLPDHATYQSRCRTTKRTCNMMGLVTAAEARGGALQGPGIMEERAALRIVALLDPHESVI